MAPAVLVPVKGFAVAKARLGPALDGRSRASLARSMADRVLAAAAPNPVFVATDDEHVAAWAMAREATVVWTQGLDLDGSVRLGLAEMRAAGFGRLLVAHADLPFASDLGEIAAFPGATIVPDRREDGTNVLSLPASFDFEPRYGPGSYRRHLAQLRSGGLAVRIARRPALRWDVDLPEDIPLTVDVAAATA